MAAKFKIGDQVRQVMPAPVEGEVVNVSVAEGDLAYLVRTPEGEERWFTVDQLEASE